MANRPVLIKNATVVTMDDSHGVLHNCDILIEGDIIAQIGTNITSDNAEIFDATTSIVCPGFIDTHRHVWQTQLRTVSTDDSLADYFAHIRNTLAPCYTAEDVYWGNYVGALESLNAGITYLVDHSHINITPDHADAAVKGLRDAGIRGTYCYGTFENPPHPTIRVTVPPGEWQKDDARRIREKYFSKPGLLRFGLAPKEVEMMDITDIAQDIQFAREIGAELITGHIAVGRREGGRRTLKELSSTNILSSDILLSHGSGLTDEELTIVHSHNIGLATTPEAELQMGMGHPIAFRAKEHGCTASLGMDIVSNVPVDMFAQMRLLLQAQRQHDFDEFGRSAQLKRKTADVLHMATMGGAEAVNLQSEIGSISVGKKADLIIISTKDIGMTPWKDPLGLIVLYAHPSHVDTVFVGGKVMKRNGKLVGVNWEEVRAHLVKSSEAIFQRSQT